MQSLPGWKNAPPVRFAASLWLGSVLLVLVLVALACATVYESTHGTEQALSVFYASWWFQLLLALPVFGVVVALAIRFPYTRAKIGFVITHASLVLILIGALVTRLLAVDGQLPLVEGETASELRSAAGERLMLTNRATGAVARVDLNPAVFGRLQAVEKPTQDGLSLDGVQVSVARYLPDSVASSTVVNDAPQTQFAVEIAVSSPAGDEHSWVFAGAPARTGNIPVALTVAADQADLQRRLADTPDTSAPSGSIGTLKIKIADREYEIPVESCMNRLVPVGQTNYQIRALDYFPHAMVGEGGVVSSASTKPVNPAVRVEILGPGEPQTQIAFAKFPDFSSIHGGEAADVKVTFVSSGAPAAPTVPVEVLTTTDGQTFVRFSPTGGPVTSSPLRAGAAVDTPWSGAKLTMLQRFDHARVIDKVEAPKEVEKGRTPAVLVTVSARGTNSDVWVQKAQPQTLTLGETHYELAYTDRALPLGFGVKLNKFTVGYYPGGRRPRSFESQITITDAASGQSSNRLISMNHPTSYGGFTFYQSSYQMMGSRAMSVLSVSRDPGQPIVFAGYIALLIGMLWVLVVRMRQRGHVGEADPENSASARGSERLVSLSMPGGS